MPKNTIEWDEKFVTLSWWLDHIGKKRWGTLDFLDEIESFVDTLPQFKVDEVETNPRWAL